MVDRDKYGLAIRNLGGTKKEELAVRGLIAIEKDFVEALLSARAYATTKRTKICSSPQYSQSMAYAETLRESGIWSNRHDSLIEKVVEDCHYLSPESALKELRLE